MRSDGGGVAQASRVPLHGAARCARALVALRVNSTHDPSILVVDVNGTPGVVMFEAGVLRSLMGVDVAEGRVVAIHVLREPATRIRCRWARARRRAATRPPTSSVPNRLYPGR
jgi:RNA polymerase sigma-70 factor, ECF subfamily